MANSERCGMTSPTNGQVVCMRQYGHEGDHVAPGHSWPQDEDNTEIARLVRQRDDWKHRAEMLQAEAETREANTVKRIVEWIRSGGIDTAVRIHPDNVADVIEREFLAPKADEKPKE